MSVFGRELIRNYKAFTCCLAVFINFSVLNARCADWPCPEPTQQVAPDISKDVREKTQSFVGVNGTGLPATVQSTVTNLWAAYPSADRIAIAQNLQSTSCNLIKTSALSSEQKIEKWLQILTILSASVSTDVRTNLQVLPNLLRQVRIGETSVNYVKSLLGVPQSEAAGEVGFVRDGYKIRIGYFTDDDSIWSEETGERIPRKGLVSAILIYFFDEDSSTKPGFLAFDGNWNNACRVRSPHFDDGSCGKLIRLDSRIGTPLSEFVVKNCDIDEAWRISKSQSKNAPPEFIDSMPVVCLFSLDDKQIKLYLPPEDHYPNDVDDLLKLQVCYHQFNVDNCLQARGMEKDDVAELEERFDIGKSIAEKRLAIDKIIKEITEDSIVVAFQIYRKAGEESWSLPFRYKNTNYE